MAPSPRSLRVLITNVGIENRTGTEIVAMDLARGLSTAGHSPMIWTPILNTSMVSDLVASGIPVVSRLQDLPFSPDVIHGHHHLETVEALKYFPGIPAIFVSHSGFWWHDAPPRHAAIRRYVGVDRFCCERLASQPWISGDRISMIHNAVDLDRFRRRPPLPLHPRRALIFSNYAACGTHLEAIQEACHQMGIDAGCAGSGVGNQTADPQHLLMDYDLVFAKARCALEAMAVGCAVVLCDTAGLGAMVLRANVEELRPWNFGFRVLTRPLHPKLIREEMQKYDAGDAAQVTDYIRANATLKDAVRQYLALYEAVLDEPTPSETPDDYPATLRLEIDDQAGILVGLPNVPATVAAGGHFVVSADIENKTALAIATSPPWPCFLMYRWIKPGSGEIVVEHGLRSILQPPIRPCSQAEYPMHVIAPPEEGDYLLRVTIIQEGWRWLDTLDPKVCAEVPVSVREER